MATGGHPGALYNHTDTLGTTSCEYPKGHGSAVRVPKGHSTILPARCGARGPTPPHLAVDAVGVVTLGALGAGEEVPLGPTPEAAAHHTHVLGERGC